MLEAMKIELSGWGGYPRVESRVFKPADFAQLKTLASSDETIGSGGLIMRGQGRSYGDAATSNSGIVVLTEQLNALGQTDAKGLLRADAGATLEDILRVVVPQGWFPAVVPGTKYVSVGGCLAADVHGKNHHRDGSFANHVTEFEILLADKTRLTCAPTSNADLFWATAGGMGLTGIIASVNLQLVPVASAFMSVQYHQAENLDATLAMLSDKSLDDSYTVMWLDCSARGRKLGRSVLLRGHHATKDELPPELRDGNPKTGKSYSINFDFPSWVLNSYSVAAFNEFYYRLHKQRQKPLVQHYEEFFFPLDRIGNWNRMYGRRGFIQYQCVFPLNDSAQGLQILLEELRAASRASFLSVLKLFGPGNKGQLSFPIEGYTLTLDLPLGDPDLLPSLDRLDELVVKFGGRVYLAKDARMRPENFKRMYPLLEDWRRIKQRVDPNDRFQSDLSRRLQLSKDGD